MTTATRSYKKILAEFAGWYGALAILAAYCLVTLEVVESQSLAYQLLNLSGALGILIISLYKKVFQSVALNIIWCLIAIVAIVQLVR